ncbi:uncharacterized protein [Hetaerina americana]|uniref:uncharacterized protein n=1 Tax=Hetaerina americana TaxID=62018 RepID=UPI003A7F1296
MFKFIVSTLRKSEAPPMCWNSFENTARKEDTVSSVAYGNGISTAGDSSKDGGCNVDHGDEGDNGIARVKVEEKAIPDKDDSMPLCIVKVESVAANDKLGIFDKGAISSEGNVFGGGAWGAEVGGNGGKSGLRGTEEEEQGVHNAVVVKTESLEEDELASCDDNSQELSTSEGDVDRDGDDAMDEGWTASAQGDVTAAWAAQQGGSVSGEDGETSLVVVKTESLAECAVDEPKSLGSVPSTRRKTNTTAGRFNQKGSKYTERLKRIVVQYAESTSTLQASEHFDIPGRTVRRWKLQSLKWKKALLGKSGPAG